MSALDALSSEFHTFVAKAEALGHTGLDRLVAVWHEITGDVPKLEAEAVADGKQIVADAETAAAPVVAEAEGDAKALLDEAEADVQAAVTPPASA